MTLPASTAAQLESIRSQLAAKSPRWGDGETHIPVERYFDPAIWQAEIRGLFRALPLVAAHSSEIATGQVLACDTFDVPVLIARDAEGVVRAFLNVCRHRGMRLVDAGDSAHSRASVVCPYHGWSYRLDGRLRHMLHAEAFDACPAGARDLVQLPCEERHGLVWVVPDAHAKIDLPAFLGSLDAELAFCDLPSLRSFASSRRSTTRTGS